MGTNVGEPAEWVKINVRQTVSLIWCIDITDKFFSALLNIAGFSVELPFLFGRSLFIWLFLSCRRILFRNLCSGSWTCTRRGEKNDL